MHFLEPNTEALRKTIRDAVANDPTLSPDEARHTMRATMARMVFQNERRAFTVEQRYHVSSGLAAEPHYAQAIVDTVVAFLSRNGGRRAHLKVADVELDIDQPTESEVVDNPTRAAARDHLQLLVAEQDALHGLIGAPHTDPTIGVAELNQRSTPAHRKIRHLEEQAAAAEANLKTIPAKLPANQIDPDAKRAIHRASRRALQMVLRLLAHNAEHWLAHHPNAHLQDPDEYRAITRNLLHLGGTITYTTTGINVRLDQPGCGTRA
jgi:hypothetical protein